MMPVKPPASTAMFVSVARSSRDMLVMPSPANSSTLPMPLPLLKNVELRMCSITSFAQTPLFIVPLRMKRAVSGTVTRTSFVYQAFAMSVEPTPNAKQPSAPAMQVCESVPATS